MPDLSAFNLSALPAAKDGEFEFKSSATPINALKKKLNRAVSGFANSGGGHFVAGVDDAGNADGGIPATVGNQDLRDWADQVIHQVEPTPSYDIELVEHSGERGPINPDCRVLVVAVHESLSGPHMANDNRYYIRASAHTVPARHFIVDSIWARRHFSKPRLSHVFRLKPGVQEVLQLGVVALTGAPAVNVEIDLSPLGEELEGYQKYFPLQIPLIDNDNPFFFDVTLWRVANKRFGNGAQLRVTYEDLAGNSYLYEASVGVTRSTPPRHPLEVGRHPLEKMAETLESIDKKLECPHDEA